MEAKAAHLLYFVVKNHPFSDGNKRSAAFLFVDFLHRNSRLLNGAGEPVINDVELITLGRLQGGGKRTKQDIADYVLIYRGQKLVVIEAKKRSSPVTDGLAQAKRYAECLQTRFAYTTNGDGIYRVACTLACWPTSLSTWRQ